MITRVKTVGVLGVGLLAIAVAVWWPAIASAHKAALARGRATGHLRLVVVGLPRGTVASLRLSGPGFSRTFNGPTTLAARPGVYHARVRAVVVGSHADGVPSGSTLFPSRPVVTVTVRAGKTAVLTVAYGTIRSSHDTTLTGAPRAVIGSPSEPAGLVLDPRQAQRLRPGSIIVSPPSGALPDGLFDRVVTVSKTHAGVALTLREASLEEAFPRLSVNQEVNLAAPPTGASAARVAADEGGWELSIDKELIESTLSEECAAATQPLPSFTPLGSIGSTLNVDLEGGLFRPLEGDIELHLTGTLGFAATLPKLSCKFSVPFVSFETAIPIGGLMVPVEGEVTAQLQLQTANPIALKAQVSATAVGRLVLSHGHGTPSVSLAASASGSASPLLTAPPDQTTTVDDPTKLTVAVDESEAKAALGLAAQVGLGIKKLNVHLEELAGVYDKIPLSGGCEIGWEKELAVGIDLFAFKRKYEITHTETPWYRCPSPPGGGFKYSATGLPPGLSINSATGEITGDPTEAGTFTASVTATGPEGESSSVPSDWTVDPAPPSPTPSGIPAVCPSAAALGFSEGPDESRIDSTTLLCGYSDLDPEVIVTAEWTTSREWFEYYSRETWYRPVSRWVNGVGYIVHEVTGEGNFDLNAILELMIAG
jgi:hypothetical protein